MANEVHLRTVPSDADADDVRLYDPTQPDSPVPPSETPPLRTMMGMGR